MDPKHKFHPWFSLLRLPNLLTVPGDTIAGFLLAGGAFSVGGVVCRLLPACLAALFLYAFGLIQNDLADMAVDRVERPFRPIVSGAVSVNFAFLAMAASGFIGVGLALVAGGRAFAAALVLYLLICAYNLKAEHYPVIGPVFMGACRATSLMLGAALTPHPLGLATLFGAATLFAYIAFVSVISRLETESLTDLSKRFFPPMALLAGLCAVFFSWPLSGAAYVAFLVFGLAAVGNALRTSLALGPIATPGKVQRSIGRFLRGLLLLQAAFVCCEGPAGIVLGILLAAAIVPAYRLSKRFSPS